jgi:preprotein translocase subunit SecD
MKYRIGSGILIALGGLLIWGMFYSPTIGNKLPFKYGLDLVGGTELVYRADTSKIAEEDIKSSMETLRDLIERRVNLFGVSEPIVQVEEAGLLSGNRDHRLIVELPGVTDIEEAKALIGKTPQLEFKIEKPGVAELTPDEQATLTISDVFVETGITGRLLKRSTLQFNQGTNQPVVALEFNDEGKALFAEVTRSNIGKQLAIFLDGELKQSPVITTEIDNGQAIITGYDAVTAREVVKELNFGSLPVPIELATTQTIGASLGEAALHAGVSAGLWGLLLTALFLILWYRLPGVIASVSLILYTLISLALFRLIPVTLTAAGLAGFILSVGMAVDANILIFERMKEELRKGKALSEALEEGFSRAWLSIRDSNISSIITAVVLFWLGTAAVKGFALTLGIGVAVSMFTAITASRTFLYALRIKSDKLATRFLFGSGVSNNLTSNQ